jgi:hypothetical protein
MSNNQNPNELIPPPQVSDGNPVNIQNQSINPHNDAATNLNTSVNSILPVSLESPDLRTHINLTSPTDFLQPPVVNRSCQLPNSILNTLHSHSI